MQVIRIYTLLEQPLLTRGGKVEREDTNVSVDLACVFKGRGQEERANRTVSPQHKPTKLGSRVSRRGSQAGEALRVM